MADDVREEVRPLEDEPVALTPDLPPEIASPLAPFQGARPPAPAWFDEALSHAPEALTVEVRGAAIELLCWGERGKPGLIFVHGNSAHAHWWSFIAPFLAADYRVAAISLSGMGASDWRQVYSFDTYAEEIFACAKAAGLYEAPVKPVYVGHSFGGALVFHSATRHADRMRAAILVDTGFGGPPTPEEFEAMRQAAIARGESPATWARPSSRRTGSNRVYPTLEAALARFRFMPPQVPGNLYIADYIARHSLKRAPLPEGGGEGWTWCFDPGLWNKLDRTDMRPTPRPEGGAPMIHIYGDRSAIIQRHTFHDRDFNVLPADMPRIVIPDSEHHIMVDQPLALVAALRAVLLTWV